MRGPIGRAGEECIDCMYVEDEDDGEQAVVHDEQVQFGKSAGSLLLGFA